MLIPNSSVFTDLNAAVTPAIIHGIYNPSSDWDETLLSSAGVGTLYVQLDSDCMSGCNLVSLWQKRSKQSDEYDWVKVTTTVIRGSVTPNAGSAVLCAAPLGSVYIEEDNDGCVEQFYIKIGDTCNGVSACPDWWPVLLQVTRSGDEFDFDPQTYTLNIPVSGKLTDEGDGHYLWTPDNGGSDIHFYIGVLSEETAGTEFLWNHRDGSPAISWHIPTLTNNNDGTYTFNPNNGGSTVTISTVSWQTKDRPWSEIGSAQATNNSSIQHTDEIYHTGRVVVGGTTNDIPGAKLEVIGNVGFGSGTNTLGNSTNSVVAGLTNTLGDTDASTIAGGTNNAINGAADANYDGNFIGGGADNTIAGGYSGIVAGQDNTITGVPNGGILAGTDNTVTGISAAVVAGVANLADGDGSVVTGGTYNTASGQYTHVIGASNSQANGPGQVVIGIKAIGQVAHGYSIIMSADPTNDPNNAGNEFQSAAGGEFAVRAPGGVRLITSDYDDSLTGVGLDADDTSWNVLSDERLKTGIVELEGLALPGYDDIKLYQYTIGSENTTVGVLAQEWYAAFGHLLPRTRENHEGYLVINQGERDAVQDLAIKELIAETDAMRAEIRNLQMLVSKLIGE